MKLSSWRQYFKERYPLPLTVPLAFFNGFLASGFLGLIVPLTSEVKIKIILAVAALHFFFMLRQRCVDEFRDYVHDCKHFPGRPVPRGLVTLAQIRVLGVGALILELAAAWWLAGGRSYWYLPALLYSVVLALEWPSRRFHQKHFTLSALIHVPVYYLLNLFVFQAVAPWTLPTAIIFVLALGSWQVWVELLRKYKPRLDPKGKPVADSYSMVWGKPQTLVLLILNLTLVGVMVLLLRRLTLPLILLLGLIFWQLYYYDRDDWLIAGSFCLALVWSVGLNFA